MSYNPAENAVLVNFDAEGGSYELHVLPKGRGGAEPVDTRRRPALRRLRRQEPIRDARQGAHEIHIKNLKDEVTKRTPPDATCDGIHAGTGTLLCRCEDKMILYDVQQRSTMAELATPSVKYVVWSSDMSLVAMLSKHAIVIANRKLGQAVTVHDHQGQVRRVDDSGVFVYTMLNHIKYALPNGDSGIIRTLDTRYSPRPRRRLHCPTGTVATDRFRSTPPSTCSSSRSSSASTTRCSP